MAKDEIENVIKRFAQITDAIKRGLNRAVFYVGKRREVIEITDEIKAVCEIIIAVCEKQSNFYIRHMINSILAGVSDVRIIQDMPCERNAYYDKKQKFSDKVYACCAAQKLVSYEDILNEEISL